MFLPIGDSPNSPKTPWVTWSLITVNVLVFLLLLPLSFERVAGDDPDLQQYSELIAKERNIPAPTIAYHTTHLNLVQWNYGVKPGQFSFVDGFTSMFLHGGLMHLLGNMLFLWIFGDNVEHHLGSTGFLLAYLATGFAGALGDSLIRWGSMVPSIGASGAISGVLGLYFLWFPKNRVRVFVFLFPFFMNKVDFPARLVLGFYLIVDNILPLLISGGEGAVSHGAHVGGFLAGLALAAFTGFNGFSTPRTQAARDRGTPLDQRFRAALTNEDLDTASALLLRERDARRGLNALDKIQLGEALEQSLQPRKALSAYQRALRDHPADPYRGQAHVGAARVLLQSLSAPTAAYQHLYAALEENPTPGVEREARRLLHVLKNQVSRFPTNPHAN